MLRIFYIRKIQRLRPGLNPRTWVLTTRPPKQSYDARKLGHKIREMISASSEIQIKHMNILPVMNVIFWNVKHGSR